MAVMPILHPAAPLAAARRQFQRGCALRRQARIRAARFASLLPLLAFRVSSPLMAAALAGALWRSPVRWIRQGRRRAMCGLARSCWRIWLASIRDRTSVVWGNRVSVSVDFGRGVLLKKKHEGQRK